MSLMVSISGIRGIVGESLTPDVVVRYASAFAAYCGRGRIVIGHDGRNTGAVITNIASSTLLSAGCDVTAIGICPTPTVQLAVEELGAAGGISVTASHNPLIWNGLKFMAPTGLFLDADQNRRFWAIADSPHRTYAPWNKIGSHEERTELLDHHIERILRLPLIDLGRLRSRRFKVVADCVNAAGGLIVPRLLRELGCEVTEMNCDVSGVFAHTPEPIPENLTDLCRRVRETGADLGIAVDPDVDRLVLITERGEPFGEEYSVAAVVQFVLGKVPGSAPASRPVVVVNLSTTRAVDDIAARFGAEVQRTPVGEINVAKRMKETGALVGGEGSGGIILPSVHLGRDAPVGIGLVLQCLLESGETLSRLKSSLPQYSITKGKIEISGHPGGDVLQRLRAQYGAEGTVNTEDGLKIDFERSWVHFRTSNTEPILRVIAEAPTAEEADRLMLRSLENVRRLL